MSVYFLHGCATNTNTNATVTMGTNESLHYIAANFPLT